MREGIPGSAIRLTGPEAEQHLHRPAVQIDDFSPAGSWRAALDPGGFCRVCCQAVCGHSDLEYAGLVPARSDAQSFHATPNSAEAQRNHG